MKRNLLKVLGISFLIYVVLSWIIPVGTYTGNTLTTNGIAPIGLVSLFTSPINAILSFALYGVAFAVIGGLYGVMEKTGALSRLTDKMAKSFSGKEKGFLILTVILFTVLSSLTGLIIPLFILVPLFAAVLFKFGYDKVTVLASTVGALLVGSVGSTYGFYISGYTKNILGLDMNSEILAKIILLVILTVALILIVLFTSKRKERKTAAKLVVEEDIVEVKVPKATKVSETKKTADSKKTTAKKTTTKATAKTTTKKTTTKKTSTRGRKPSSKSNTKGLAIAHDVKKVSDKKVSIVPLVVILALVLIFAILGMYNWYYAFGIDVFNNFYDSVMKIKIGDFEIFKNLFAGSSQFGYWSNVDFIALVFVGAGIIAWLYKLSLNDFVESFIAGVKAWIPTAIYVTLASIVLTILYSALSSGSGTIVDTINSGLFGLSDGFNVILTGIAGLIGSFFFNDLYYLLTDMTGYLSGFDVTSLPVAGLLVQAVYGIGMMIFPTSAMLIAGLSLFDVSYKDWIKYIWKFALIAFLLVLLVCGILTLL